MQLACVLCKETSGHTSNVMKHLKSKHHEEFQVVQAQQEEAKCLSVEQRRTCTTAEQSKQVSLETTLEWSRVYPRELTCCKKLDDSLVRMLAVDLQPASLVEDRGFLTILHAQVDIVPWTTLPDLYQRVKVEVRAKLASTKNCGLTTDIWTSRTTQGYNIVAAVRLNGWKHMPCFAHTLNLIVQDSINGDSQLTGIQKKCCNIVSYFYRSSKATNKLLESLGAWASQAGTGCRDIVELFVLYVQENDRTAWGSNNNTVLTW